MQKQKNAESLRKDSVISQVANLVSELAGIQLGEKQWSMLESRLKGRMSKLRITSFDEYEKYLNSNKIPESQALLSLMTTHHTFFFREFNHFEFLLNKGLNPLIEKARQRPDKKIRIWSAACSKGQEVYSLAMFMNFHLSVIAPDVQFEIWGTDVDPESVRIAKNGIYKMDELKQAPSMYVTNNWIVGTGTAMGFYKVKPGLQAKCRFETVNLLESDSFLKGKEFDLIFCRNVFIYFNQQQIKKCGDTFLKHLDSDGFIFLGVSETFNGLSLKIDSLGSSVYRHPVSKRTPQRATVEQNRPLVPVRKEIRVLSVDDSPAILAILKKVFATDSIFKLVGTAKNGLEALAFLKKETVDIITLDLHMPEMDGLQFLESSERNRDIPVMIMSSINREDPSIAKKAMSLGAADYVEKPSLENLGQAANEICSKLKTIMSMSSPGPGQSKPNELNVGSISKVKSQKKKVLIVDDSLTIRQLLSKIIGSDPDLEVVAMAEKPSQVEDLIKQHKPDVITLDIHMPEMDGVTLLKRLHPLYKIPTVMITSVSKEEGPQILQALEIGAVDYIQKPEMSSLGQLQSQIRERIKAAAEAKVQKKVSVRKAKSSGKSNLGDLVLIGASTGGTEAIKSVLEALPSQIPPILIVQHIPAGFSAAFAKRLNELFPFEVKEAKDGDEVKPNCVLIAPGGTQMAIVKVGPQLKVRVTDDAPVNRHKPSVDYMFNSAVKLGLDQVVAVIMTGMGADGAKGLKALKEIGCQTVAQDQSSCVVFGMPREAIALGAASYIKPLSEIGATIIDLTNSNQKENKDRKAS